MLYILPAMARSDPQVNFRIPGDLLQRIKVEAARNNRTITAELVSRLEASFGRLDPLPEPSADAILMAHKLLGPALVEIAKIETEARQKLADGLSKEQVEALMGVKIDHAASIGRAFARVGGWNVLENDGRPDPAYPLQEAPPEPVKKKVK